MVSSSKWGEISIMVELQKAMQYSEVYSQAQGILVQD